jgi:hypothetical protein
METYKEMTCADTFVYVGEEVCEKKKKHGEHVMCYSEFTSEQA